MRRAVAVAILSVIAMLTAGCAVGSLASNTGPTGPTQTWSTVKNQMVHVDETVKFEFLLLNPFAKPINPVGVADYVVTTVGQERIEADPDEYGRFRFEYTFSSFRPGDEVEIRSSAFKERSGRDFMKIGGDWMRAESPFNEPDTEAASDVLCFEVYQGVVRARINAGTCELEPDTGVLTVKLLDGETRTIYIDRPHRPGFVIMGPDESQAYWMEYKTRGDEVNKQGLTDFEFVIYDSAGQPHKVTGTFDTP